MSYSVTVFSAMVSTSKAGVPMAHESSLKPDVEAAVEATNVHPVKN